MDKRMSYREIARECGLSLYRISEILKGTPLPILKKSKMAPEKLEERKEAAEPCPYMLSRGILSKLWVLAMDEGYLDLNKWANEMLMPWYKVKRDLEWMLRTKLVPSEFAGYIELCMLDSLELKDLKNKLSLRTTASSYKGESMKAARAQPVCSDTYEKLF
jgi:transcriptional regulator with XRE-family HTH domain